MARSSSCSRYMYRKPACSGRIRAVYRLYTVYRLRYGCVMAMSRQNKLVDTKNILPGDEPNMADQQTLADFISRTFRQFPADHYGLILWDHGMSWTGYSVDEDPGPHAYLTFKQVLRVIKTFAACVAVRCAVSKDAVLRCRSSARSRPGLSRRRFRSSTSSALMRA